MQDFVIRVRRWTVTLVRFYMTQQRKNKIRALILLTVFSLNTMAGFACSIGLNMGYNAHHHEGHDKAHKSRECLQHHMGCLLSGIPTTKAKATNDDCCSGQVNSFARMDKAVAYNNLLLKAPLFSPADHTYFFALKKEGTGITVNSRFQFVRRSCFLNDTTIQLSIRRFQIWSGLMCFACPEPGL